MPTKPGSCWRSRPHTKITNSSILTSRVHPPRCGRSRPHINITNISILRPFPLSRGSIPCQVLSPNTHQHVNGSDGMLPLRRPTNHHLSHRDQRTLNTNPQWSLPMHTARDVAPSGLLFKRKRPLLTTAVRTHSKLLCLSAIDSNA